MTPRAPLIFATLLALGVTSFGDPKSTPKSGDMIKIAGGTFTMGKDDPDAVYAPAHKVTVKGFEMDKTPVTAAAYQACLDAKACKKGPVDERDEHCTVGHKGWEKHPANCIVFAGAKDYCAWVGKRLPTEEEWEYAARGSEGRTYPWGNTDLTDKQACYKRGEGWTKPEDVGSCEVGAFPAGNTPQGLQDMAGNVEEWTTAESTNGYGRTPSEGETNYVVRGGSWFSVDPRDLTTFARSSDASTGYHGSAGSEHTGFRCVK